MIVGQLRSSLGSRRGGANHGDTGDGLEFGAGGHHSVVEGADLAVELGDETDDRSITPKVATSTVSFVVDQFGFPFAFG